MSEIFIRRPVMTTLIACGLLFFGVVSYRALPNSDLPNVAYPTIVVSAALPGADPGQMASSVASPLERQLTTINGLNSMVSVNTTGSTQITLQFDLSRDIDGAAGDVQAMIAKASGDLPNNLPMPPYYQKVNPADMPVLWLTVSSPTLPISQVNNYAQNVIANRLSMVSGVAEVDLLGEQKYAVRVQVDPRALAARGLGLDEVVQAVQRQNSDLPRGILDGKYQSFTLLASGQLNRAKDYRPMIVASRDGSPIRLQDIGRVIDGVEQNKNAGWVRYFSGTNPVIEDEQTIFVSVKRQPGANTLDLIKAAKKVLAETSQQLPGAVEVKVIYDQAELIGESVSDVKFTLVLAVGLVVMVIFLFLRSLSGTVIAAVAIPLSLVATCAAMYFMKFNLDSLSLMALTLAVGFVVDDAIVVMENVFRHVETGKPPFQAAIDGAREIGGTILSMTLSLAAVFIPIMFMGGIVGRLFREFAWTIAVAVLVSGFVSLTLTPMLCGRLMRGGGKMRPPDSPGGRLTALYGRTLRLALRWRGATLLVSLALLALTGYLFTVTPTAFLPNEDQGFIMVFTQAAEGTSFEEMARLHKQLWPILDEEGATLSSYCTLVGQGSFNAASNLGILGLNLKPRSQRKMTADQFVAHIAPRLAVVPGLKTFVQNPPPIQINAQMTKSEYQYTVQGLDSQEVFRAAQDLEEKLRALPELQDVTSDLLIGNPQATITIDRDKASRLHVRAEQVEAALWSSFASRQVSNIYGSADEYKVIVELLPRFQADPSSLSLLYVRAGDGQMVPLATLASVTFSRGPLTVNHQNQFPAVTLSFNPRKGVALGAAVSAVQRTAGEALPPTVGGRLRGSAEAFKQSLGGMPELIIFALLTIYMILGILYESFLHPLTVLSGLPAAALGGLLTLRLFGAPLDFYAFVGIIMLIGIVKKNAIMVIDFAIARRKQGKPPAEAVYEGCLVRLRPIMMTTVAATAGALPIAVGLGAGAESRRPLGLVVVGGLVLSQVVTLYLTPVFYVYMEQLQGRLRRRFGRPEDAPVAAPAPAPQAATV